MVIISKHTGLAAQLKSQELKHSYSDNISNKRIAVLGNFPPPLGGVSVHIKRVMHKLKGQHNKLFHFDTSKRSSRLIYTIRLVLFLLTKRCDIVYYHTLDLNRRLSELQLLLKIKKIMGYQLVIVEHNCRYLYTKSVSFKKSFNYCMQKVDALVFIGNSTWYSYLENKIIVPAITTIESAFLPPDESHGAMIVKTYPVTLHDFLFSHSPIVLVNAFQLSMLDGKDLYGIDLCIQALSQLKKEHRVIGLVCGLSQLGSKEHFAYLQQEIKKHNLENHIYFLMDKKELWPLFKKVDLFVRPTLSDGESVSVQEALYFNVPVVASDAVARPRQVITFSSGDAMDLSQKIKSVLGDTLYESNNQQRNHLHT